MKELSATMAERIARAAVEFQQKATGHPPKSVTVIHGEDTLVISLAGALTPAEQMLAQTAEGAAQMQEFHRRLFDASSDSLRREIRQITGLDVCEAAAELEPASGGVRKVLTAGTVVQIFRLAGKLPADAWSGPADSGR